MPDGIAKTSIYLPKEDLKLLKKAAIEAGVKVNDLLVSAVKPFLSAFRKGDTAPVTKAVASVSSGLAVPPEVAEFWWHPKDRVELLTRNSIAAKYKLPELKDSKLK